MLKRRQFQRMSQKSHRLTGRWILIDIRLTAASFSRLGITVTKKFGSAPHRNRFKRIVREAFRTSYADFNLMFDVVIRPRTLAATASMSDIQEELLFLIGKAKGIKEV